MQDSLIFVGQKHQATRLDYDFRLELDGVLKSWAVPLCQPVVALVPKSTRSRRLGSQFSICLLGLNWLLRRL